MNTRGKLRLFSNGEESPCLWDDDADLVQNNGRVTLPITAAAIHLTKKQLSVVLLVAASIFAAFLVARK